MTNQNQNPGQQNQNPGQKPGQQQQGGGQKPGQQQQDPSRQGQKPNPNKPNPNQDRLWADASRGRSRRTAGLFFCGVPLVCGLHSSAASLLVTPGLDVQPVVGVHPFKSDG